MRLVRREILEQLVRLGIRELNSLKSACRNYEIYWENIHLSRTKTMCNTEAQLLISQ
jgi:hypothetical protein